MNSTRSHFGGPRAVMTETTTTGDSPPRISGDATYAFGLEPLEFSCIEPGTLFDIEVVDAAGQRLWGREDLLLGPGELRHLEVDLPPQGR